MRVKRKNGSAARLLSMLIAAALILLVTPLFGGDGRAAEDSAVYTLTVQPGGEELAEELEEADVVVDLYRVANLPGDSARFELIAPYGALTIPDPLEESDVRALAQRVAEIALDRDTPYVTGAPAGTVITAADNGEALSAGMYLVIARGRDVQDYVLAVTDESGADKLVTAAYSAQHLFSYEPMLIALSGSGESEGTEAGETPEPVPLTVTLKPEQELRKGDLEIVKTLLSYEDSGAVTFVFSIEAVLEGDVVYSDVAALTFTAAGQDSILIRDLPVGAEVTVTEIYSGAGYKLVSDKSRQAWIVSDELASVSFVNTYDGDELGGHGIVNHFEYSEDNGWSWTQLDSN